MLGTLGLLLLVTVARVASTALPRAGMCLARLGRLGFVQCARWRRLGCRQRLDGEKWHCGRRSGRGVAGRFGVAHARSKITPVVAGGTAIAIATAAGMRGADTKERLRIRAAWWFSPAGGRGVEGCCSTASPVISAKRATRGTFSFERAIAIIPTRRIAGCHEGHQHYIPNRNRSHQHWRRTCPTTSCPGHLHACSRVCRAWDGTALAAGPPGQLQILAKLDFLTSSKQKPVPVIATVTL